MTDPGPEVQLTIGSRFENIELVKVVLDDCLQRRGADADTRHWVEMAMREAVANAIKHGNRQDPTKKVAIEMGIDGDDIVISVADEGTGFDPQTVHDPLALENRFKRDGRGIFYMRSFMDKVDYRFRPEGGTVLTLRKRVPTTPTQTQITGGGIMKVDTREKSVVAILDLKGKFTIGAGDAAIREAIQKCAADGKLQILLNTAGVTTIDSSGIGELVAGFTTVTNRGGKLKLLNLPPKLEDILQVTQLITVFDVFEDEATALASFAS